MFACFFLSLNDFIPFRLGEGQFNFSERIIQEIKSSQIVKTELAYLSVVDVDYSNRKRNYKNPHLDGERFQLPLKMGEINASENSQIPSFLCIMYCFTPAYECQKNVYKRGIQNLSTPTLMPKDYTLK